MNNKEKLLLALGEVDERYVAESGSKLKKSVIIKAAVVLTLVISLSLYLFIPFAPITSDLRAYEGSAYYPLIEKVDEYHLSFLSYKYKNYFQLYMARLGIFAPKSDVNDAATNDAVASPPKNEASNGDYKESTDNQVEGVIESDLMKMTDKYIFRVGLRHEQTDDVKGRWVEVLRVYSIDKENSTLICEYEIPRYDEEKNYLATNEMYLSSDGNTVTLLKEHSNMLFVVSIDVSDVNNITEKGHISIDGSLKTTRMVDGKLIVVSNYFFNRRNMDYSNPATFVPTIDSGDGAKPIEFRDIIYPDKITNTNYSVVTLIDTDNLSLLGAKALLNFTSDVYISQNSIYISREYVSRIENKKDPSEYESSNLSDIAILDYSGDELVTKNLITVDGWTKDQYSFDEYQGYLRVVTSTTDIKSTKSDENDFQYFVSRNRSASLYVLDLQTGEVRAKVENFAPEGEQATAVRFDGDKCYVCTAEVVSFTDPVFFFDLRDYDNITYTDTGIIEGYSDSLIEYGDGRLLGIGREGWQYGKVDVYKEIDGQVVAIDQFKFGGIYSTDYKSYLVDRDNGLFGFAVESYFEINNQTQKYEYYNCYILITVSEDEMTVQKIKIDLKSATDVITSATDVRAVYSEGYLYITTNKDLTVEKIN